MRVVKTMAAGEEAEGYECSFVETPPEGIDTECPICLLVLKQPSQVECCGRVFCTGCLQRALRDGNDRCPMCNARAPRMFTDQNFRRILAGFHVYCVHRWCGEEERGCQWTGELGQLGSHLDPNQNQEGCLFVNITCSLCGEAMKRSSLSQHQESDCPKRSYSCPHCHIQTNYDNIVNSHLDECLCYPCPCPHCDLIAERCELHLHIDSECILAPVPCPFQPVGCQGNLLRLELATHTKKSVGNHAQLLLEAGGTSGEHIALYRSSLEEICLENSELSLKVAAFAVQHDADEKRINSRHNIQLALFLVIGVLILVIIALATK